MKRSVLPFLLAMLLCISGCTPAKQKLGRYNASFLTLFDTVTVITGYAENEAAFRATAQSIHDDLLEYHQLFNRYEDYPGIVNVKTLNDQAGGGPVEVDRRILDLLLFCQEIYEQTDGQVNVAMGSVLTLWHDARTAGIDDPEQAALPDDEALREAAQHMDFSKVILDRERSTVQITDPQLRLDVGAIAKGYAVEQVCQRAPEGILVSVGGNVRPTGPKPDATPWKVSIQDPDGETGESLRTVLVNDQSVVVSGDYQRYYTVNGVRYPHIIDPQTRYPAKQWKMVAILCADSGLADALSTALFCLSREEGQALLTLYEAEALWVAPSGDVSVSLGFPSYLAEESLIDKAEEPVV